MAMSEWLKDLNKTYSDSLNKIDKYNERINTSNATYNVNAFSMGKYAIDEKDKNDSKLKYDLVAQGVDLNRSLISNALDPNGKQYREQLFVDINKNLEARKMNPMTRWEFDNTLVKVKEAEDAKKKDNVVPLVVNDDAIKITNVVNDASKYKYYPSNDISLIQSIQDSRRSNIMSKNRTTPQDQLRYDLNSSLKEGGLNGITNAFQSKLRYMSSLVGDKYDKANTRHDKLFTGLALAGTKGIEYGNYAFNPVNNLNRVLQTGRYLHNWFTEPLDKDKE